MNSTEPGSKDVQGELAVLRLQVEELQRRSRRSAWMRAGAVAVVAVLLGGNLAWAQLRTFTANNPAVAADVNFNFDYLKTWVEARVGPLGAGAAPAPGTSPIVNTVPLTCRTLNTVCSTNGNAVNGLPIYLDNHDVGVLCNVNEVLQRFRLQNGSGAVGAPCPNLQWRYQYVCCTVH